MRGPILLPAGPPYPEALTSIYGPKNLYRLYAVDSAKCGPNGYQIFRVLVRAESRDNALFKVKLLYKGSGVYFSDLVVLIDGYERVPSWAARMFAKMERILKGI